MTTSEMTPFETTARELVRTLDKAALLLERYMVDSAAFAAEHGRDNLAGGMHAKQLRRRLQAEVIARLSPKPVCGLDKPPVQLDGAPEARRYVAAHPLPGLK